MSLGLFSDKGEYYPEGSSRNPGPILKAGGATGTFRKLSDKYLVKKIKS